MVECLPSKQVVASSNLVSRLTVQPGAGLTERWWYDGP